MRIVCIGGGHGVSAMLSALKSGEHDISAIISTTDDGGSTGRLRKDQRHIALGDIRRCIDTLADPQQLMSCLSQYRLTFEHDVKGHTVGNIILSALCEITKSPTQAIAQYCDMLNVKQAIYPMSDQPIQLVARTHCDNHIYGECAIDGHSALPKSIALSDPKAKASENAVKDILNADLILIGPGSTLTSIAPPLLIREIKEALNKTSAYRIFIESKDREKSVMSQVHPREHASWLERLLGFSFYDTCLNQDTFNTFTPELNLVPNFTCLTKLFNYPEPLSNKNVLQLS